MIAIAMLRELEFEIEAVEDRVRQLQRELYAAEKINDTYKVNALRYAEKVLPLSSRLESYKAILADKVETKREIEAKLNKLDKLQYTVAYKRHIQGMGLKQIAEELGYEYGYIREVSSRANKALKNS